MDMIVYMNAQKIKSGQSVAQTFSKVLGEPIAGFPSLGKIARAVALWLRTFARGVAVILQMGDQGLVGEMLSSVHLMCACCYCSQPGRTGGCDFA